MKKKTSKSKFIKEGTKEKITKKNLPTLNLRTESEVAMDFATKAYQTFDKAIKSIILFGSAVKNTATHGSDIDIIIVIDEIGRAHV